MHASELPPSTNVKPRTSFPPSLAYTYTLDGTVVKAMNFTGTLDIPECSVTDFQYWTLSPIMANGWALLGELNKVLPVSETRVVDIITSNGDIHVVYLSGEPGEVVPMTVYDTGSGTTEVTSCTIDSSGNSYFLFPHGPCVDSM